MLTIIVMGIIVILSGARWRRWIVWRWIGVLLTCALLAVAVLLTLALLVVPLSLALLLGLLAGLLIVLAAMVVLIVLGLLRVRSAAQHDAGGDAGEQKRDFSHERAFRNDVNAGARAVAPNDLDLGTCVCLATGAEQTFS